MKALSVDAIFTSFGSRADGSLSFRGSTPELTTTEKVALMDTHGRVVKLLIQPIGEDAEELIEVKAPLGFASPSKRLRAILFVQFKQQKLMDTTFDQFYTSAIELYIDRIKSQLNPE